MMKEEGINRANISESSLRGQRVPTVGKDLQGNPSPSPLSSSPKLPPLTFICELPPSDNPRAAISWSDPSLSLSLLGPILDKHFNSPPYLFQQKAIPKVIAGSDLLITAGTGSGKSEIFLLAVLELLLRGEISSALLFYPSKQLVQDQEVRLAKYIRWVREELGKKITFSTYTGDLKPKSIEGIERAKPDILLATFDKLFYRIVGHSSIVASTSFLEGKVKSKSLYQEAFFTRLITAGVVVFDEVHDYSGLMLSNIHNYLLIHKQKNPTCRIVLSSATLPNPEAFRDRFLPSAEIISGQARRGRLQILSVEKQHLDSFLNCVQKSLLSDTRDSPSSSPLVPFASSPQTRRLKPFSNQKRAILFNDNISENESFTFLLKKELAQTTGLPLDAMSDYSAAKIACIHSQLPPERKRRIMEKTQNKQLAFLVSTALLAQGVDFPDIYLAIQIGWPINGLVGALQRLGRIRFSENLEALRYFFFMFDPEKEPDNYFLNFPSKLAEQLLEGEIPPLTFSHDNSRIAQGFLLLSVAYGLTALTALSKLYAGSNNGGNQRNCEVTHLKKLLRQALTALLAKGILTITDDELSFGSEVELAQFLREYHLRAIPPKWLVKELETKNELFSLAGHKVLRWALPGNVLLNDGIFWLVKELKQNQKEVYVEHLEINADTLDLRSLKPNSQQPPEFLFGRFARVQEYGGITLEYGELSISRRPSKITLFHPLHGFSQMIVTEQLLQQTEQRVQYTFREKTTGLVLQFKANLLQNCLGYLTTQSYELLQLFLEVFLREAFRRLNLSRREIRTAIRWQKGGEAIAIYDLAGPNGISQRIFAESRKILENIRTKLLSCECKNGCGKCYPKLGAIFSVNPKFFLLKLLEVFKL
ncbi:MAG: DEAD/DEAH box helicase [Candidatus Heimdallarchaeota archaeon]|nr:DEAD/DEAH box helicase [Candidatus Heimdallarchaeota archaeon]